MAEIAVAPDNEYRPMMVALDGKLMTAVDSALVGRNFKTLKNLRYTDTHVKGVKGMSKVNTVIPNYVSGISPITSGCGEHVSP